MASIFTYETEPVKVASPWPVTSSATATVRQGRRHDGTQGLQYLAGIEMPVAEPLSRCGISKLEAEPQEGPTEYKLHLLLRPRRSFSATSTVQKVSGSYLSKSRSPGLVHVSKPGSGTSSPSLAPSSQSRQNRLQHLTTQLLWRLQQSSPHHSSSKSDLVLPVLPEADAVLTGCNNPGRLIAGLEESLGALYEIGISDDGTFVGLTLDELEESLHVLRAMAHSLGCTLRVLRWVVVGDCQWEEEPTLKGNGLRRTRSEQLWVAEVLVAPHLKTRYETSERSQAVTASAIIPGKPVGADVTTDTNVSEQLRISLTGSTTSGKSSLLGTLSTSTLDNGRGKSRLSLLKHRHEIVSGVTSSLAQELIGYHDTKQSSGTDVVSGTNIVNYASGNVSSWTDIHNSSEAGRLVFLTDSAGHPKFRRTTVRGLISWAPHWTLCCVAADDDEDSTGKIGATATSSEVLGSVGQGIDLSKSHLELCLKLNLPLVVVITKLDLASRNGLRQTVSKILSTLKAAGRRPAVLAGTAPNPGISDAQGVLQADQEAVRKAIDTVPEDESHLLVPIVLTSALTGVGIGQTHALLSQLPILPTIHHCDERTWESRRTENLPSAIFHIDEIFAVADTHKDHVASGANANPRFILSGYSRYGSLETGDSLLLGPFSPEEQANKPLTVEPHRFKSLPGLSKSLPKDMKVYAQRHCEASADFTIAHQQAPPHSNVLPTWQSVQVTSLRYLRLPVRKLSEGQVGTVAISASQSLYLNAEPCLRRGMVLTRPSSVSALPPAYTRITAVFADPNIYVNPGSSVILYTASIRTSAKIVEVKVPDEAEDDKGSANDVFAFDDSDSFDDPGADDPDSIPRLEEIEITFQFSNSREWVEMGTKVMVTPASGISMLNPPPTVRAVDGNGAGSGHVAGLDGFVGKVVNGFS